MNANAEKIKISFQPLTESNIESVFDLCSKNEKFLSIPYINFKKGTLGDEGFLSDFSLIAYIMDSSQPIGALIAVTRKGHTFGKNAFIKILIIDKPYQRQGLGTQLFHEFFKHVLSTFCLGNLKSGWETQRPRYWEPGVDIRHSSLFFFLLKMKFHIIPHRQNLTVDLTNLTTQPATEKNGYQIMRVTPADYDATVKFVRKEFGGGTWPEEALISFENEPPTTFIAKDSKRQVVGFSTHNAFYPGSFGPTGVA